jgi:hypothetical protein
MDMLPLEQKIEEICGEQNNKLDVDSEVDKLPQFQLKIDDLLSVIDEISKTQKGEEEQNVCDMNIIYDSDMNKINVLEEDGIWNESLVNQGLRTIIRKVQDGYLDTYECYMIKRFLYSENTHEKQCCNDLLDEYYRFIAAFDLPPFCKDREDYMIDINLGEKEYTISDEFNLRYTTIKKDLKGVQRNQIRKTVLDIIKRNSAKNIKNLNNNIYELFCQDSVFKEFVNGTLKPTAVIV